MSVKLIVAFRSTVSLESVALRTETFNFGNFPESIARAERAAEKIKSDFENSNVKVITSVIDEVYE